MGGTPSGAVGAEDIRHLERRAGHGPGLRRAVRERQMIERAHHGADEWVATRV